MTPRKHRWIIAAALFAGPWIGAGLAGEEQGYVGSEECSVCHEEIVDAFVHTGHAKAPGWNAEQGCESCHGPMQAHVEGDPEAVIKLTELPPHESSQICASCHDKELRRFRSGHSVHSLNDVACVDCHNSHSANENSLRATGAALCENCHASQVAQFELPRAHPLGPQGMECESCHEPHTSQTLRARVGFNNEACAGCHIEQAGPFVYGHDTMLVDGCQSCHQVHGSSNRHLLTHERQPNLCYSCHSASITPAWHSAPRFLNEKCEACHTAIHGSNTNPYFLEE